ncbi:unnamed protein product [Auanema sp. JU1783]|nr:unnamed protein product [Auanema sp. JU1783]
MLFRNFLTHLRQSHHVFVIGMSRTSEIDPAIKTLFEAEINLSYPDFLSTYGSFSFLYSEKSMLLDLCADLISQGWKNNQLRKQPSTLWDVLIVRNYVHKFNRYDFQNTTALNCGEVISNIRNNWFQN